ncbi:MAG: hypothetical protein ABIP20_16515 [Chthoniobacteraceae bacterium]
MKTLSRLILIFIAAVTLPVAFAYVDDAHSRAMEAATPAVKEGYLVRQEYWAGALVTKQPSVVKHQLFKGNSYWFWIGSDEDSAQVTVHIYDPSGKLVEAESWQRGNMAAAKVVPKMTGTYLIVFSIEQSKAKKNRWALAYGYK